MGSLRTSLGRGAFAFAFLSLAVAPPAFAGDTRLTAATPLQTAPDPSRRQDWLIPGIAAGVEMKTTILLPAGHGPHPLAIINHGTTKNAEERAFYAEPSFPPLREL